MKFKDLLNNTELVLIEQEDKKTFLDILKIRNEKKIRDNMINTSFISQEEHLKWFKDQIENKKQLFLLVYYNRKLCGLASFRYNDSSWAFYISESSNRGLGAIVEYKFLNKLFFEMRYEKINCVVFEFNSSVIKLHKKFGFTEISRTKIFSEKLKQEANLIKMELNIKDWTKFQKMYKKKFQN